MSQTSIDLYLKKQRQLYASVLPGKISSLHAALQQLGDTGAPEALASALQQAHKLVGSGGTFGFPEVSEAATIIEKLLTEITADAGPQALSQTDNQALRAALARPASRLNAAAAVAATAKDDDEVPSTSPHTPRLIDIIEPDPQAAKLLAAQLKQAGYPSQIFAHPEQLNSAQDRPAAVLANTVFFDHPLLAAHHQDRRAPQQMTAIPLIFISGDRGFQARLDAVRAGAVGYFPQPLDVPALLAMVSRVTSEEPVRPYRVLIVEDDEALASFYALALQSVGMETCAVTDPSQVMTPLLELQPDLITCDIHMPQCNGIELAALIRQQPEFVRIPIVFLSTETSLDRQAQALRQGGDDFITKPVAPAELIAAAQSRARRYRSLLAAEDTLRISEERFRLIFETSLDGLIQGYADGGVISANQAACSMFLMSEQQIKAAGINGLIDPNDARGISMLRERRRTGKFRGELSCVRGDGTRFPAEVSFSQHVSSHGDEQLSVILRDITERKLAEQEIMQLNASLESRVEQRTEELSAVNRELQAFSHSLAHDLRQPYIAVSGLTGLLEKELGTTLSERGKNYIQRIRAGISQMNERTDTLLALAQLSRTAIHREPVDLGAIARDQLETLKRQSPGRVVHLQVQQPMMARADASLMSHLLSILLENAWKFTSREADASITVGAQSVPQRETIYFVKDNGVGFDMAYVGNMFDAFQRLHAPDEFPGAGIGLATARGIVTRHGGQIWATANPGEGAQFCFTLGKDSA